MAIFSSTSPPSSPESAQRASPNKRAPPPSATRLSTIVEGQAKNRSSGDRVPATPPLPTRSPWRALAYGASPRSPWSSTTSIRTAPPPSYEWVSEPIEQSHDSRQPVEGEKLAALRRGEILPHRGGLKRLGLWILLVLLVVIGLAVGLGVGLTVGRRRNNPEPVNVPTFGNPDGNNTNLPFPLGTYSIVTVLRSVSTSCTSNAATWQCPPFSTYNSFNAGTTAPSTEVFDWVITNTSSIYASNATDPNISTPENGIPANLTIRSTNNPFKLFFREQNVTYHATAGNASSSYYTFSFPYSFAVSPPVPLTSDMSTSTCFFNQTTVTARLYLSAPSTVQFGNNTGAAFTPWPFALDLVESSPSGTDVPACYVTVNNVVGARITTGLDPIANAPDCSCIYQNY